MVQGFGVSGLRSRVYGIECLKNGSLDWRDRALTTMSVSYGEGYAGMRLLEIPLGIHSSTPANLKP